MKDDFSYMWLFICIMGIMSSLGVYGITLEYATSQGRNLDELSFVFATTVVYAIVAYVAREVVDEKASPIPTYELLALAAASTGSGITSIHSLHYVIYPVQVVFKSCKPVPVMLFGLCFGRRHSLAKWFNIVLITVGVALFLGINNVANLNGDPSDRKKMLLGIATLTTSLICDGITGALEDKLMSRHDIGPFNLMFHVQLGKAAISVMILLLTNGFDQLMQLFEEGYTVLLILGTTGAIGQVFTFLTISKFGAINCAVIGLVRKLGSLVLSFIVYHHPMSWQQYTGLLVASIGMLLNFCQRSEPHAEPLLTAVEEKQLSMGGHHIRLLPLVSSSLDLESFTDEVVSEYNRSRSLSH